MPNRSLSGPAPAAPHAADRPSAMRVGDHLALDFLNSNAAPRGVTIEWIENGRDLLDWLAAAGVLESAEAERIAGSAPPAVLDGAAEEAVDLREWFRDVIARAKTGGLDAVTNEDVERLNRVLARDAMFQRVEPAGADKQLRVVTDRPWREPGELLVPLAVAMAQLLCEGDLDLVRRCENPACTLWFYDRTKGHRRRWCSQAVCGNRAKVAAHRERKRLAR
ncbi:MAG: CGNR zinc finger domain-containing protein [Solirubrobacteraceae bacterium]